MAKLKEMNNQEAVVKINRRQYDRVRAQLSLEYRVISEDGTSHAWNSTMTKNISAVGLCLESFHPLALNTVLEISLRVPFFQEPIRMKAQVVRAIEIKLGEIYGVAVAITDIKQTDRKKLQIELEQIDITAILEQAVELGASDLHLSLGHPPMMRIAGGLVPMEDSVLGKMAIKKMIFSLLNEQDIELFNQNSELNTAITLVTVSGTYRFRLNVFLQQEIVEAVFHTISMPVPSLDDLQLPEVVAALARNKSGLVILTGPAGCGKTTTCAAMIDMINNESKKVVTIIQKPLEYIFEQKQSIIRQRQIGVDTKSYSKALEDATLQNSDVIVLGEMPDVKTFELALAAAQNGALVLVTISSPGISAVLNQIIYTFPSDRHYYIRKIISECLKGVIFQKLIPLKNNKEKRIAATEVLINMPEIAAAIREGFFDKIPDLIVNDTNYDMHDMEKSVKKLCDQGLIDDRTAKAV